MPLPPLFLPLLAESSPLPDPSSALAVGFVALTLFAIAAGLNQALSLWKNMRSIQQPDPGHISLDRMAAIERKVRELELKIENHMGGINSKFESISNTLTNLQTDWNYAIGRIDGRHESDH
jgi:hypothetical protein